MDEIVLCVFLVLVDHFGVDFPRVDEPSIVNPPAVGPFESPFYNDERKLLLLTYMPGANY
jgi:hypothetical protein